MFRGNGIDGQHPSYKPRVNWIEVGTWEGVDEFAELLKRLVLDGRRAVFVTKCKNILKPAEKHPLTEISSAHNVANGGLK